MSSATTTSRPHGRCSMMMSLLDPTFGVPTDVTFQIMGFGSNGQEKKEILLGEVKGHKTILGLFSPVFRKEFYGQVKETTDIILVRETTLESFERMIDYIYNKNVKLRSLSVLEMFDVVNMAEKYQIKELLEVVKSQVEKFSLTMENIMEVADTAAQFTQFPSISSTLLLTCAKFLSSTLQTPEKLLNFASDQSGGGMEVTVLRLMSLIRNLPVPICTNCGEKECKKGKVVEIMNKLTKGSRLIINPKLYTGAHNDLIITVISSRPQYIMGKRSSDNQEVEFHIMHEGHPRFCYKCD